MKVLRFPYAWFPYAKDMLLSQLVHLLGATFQPSVASVSGHDNADVDVPDMVVSGVSHKADWITTGQIFVAIKGARFDGHQFAEQAAEAGAVAIIGEGWTRETPSPLPYVRVQNVRQALAQVAASLEGEPSKKMHVVGITGTDGKTTTAWLVHHLMRAAGLSTGLLSTVGYVLPDGELQQFPAHFTTPEAPQLQQTLRQMQEAGAHVAILEASSHALALDRVYGIEWDTAIWTQLTSEHLDFHGTRENYFAEKRKLIERARFAILNADDECFADLRATVEATDTPFVSYSIAEPRAELQTEPQAADWQALNIQEGDRSIQFELNCPLGRTHMTLPMIGRFNVCNALAALATTARLGASLEQLQAGLASFAGVHGRMQLVTAATTVQPKPQPRPRVVVDFAHTPDSLAKVLKTLRANVQPNAKLWVLIGSAGGLRDPSKRAPLGKVAVQHADFAVFTEEDCRDTPIDDILATMVSGAKEAEGVEQRDFCCMADRREAIRWIVQQAAAQDTVLLAGKGAEYTLERADETLPWDEVAEAKEALAQWDKASTQ